MILLREDITWLGCADGSVTPFNESRLAASIEAAAAVVRLDDEPSLAESIAAAVHQCVHENAKRTAVAVREIAEMVESVLSMLGYKDVADAYAQAHLSAEIRLDEVLTQPGTVMELDFYRRLDVELGASARNRVRVLQLFGLRRCALRLRGTKRWGTGCQRLAEEIVNHIRGRLAQAGTQIGSSVRWAVLE